MNTTFDSINTEHKKCGCIVSSNLDIIENTISEVTITMCIKHFKKYKKDLNILNLKEQSNIPKCSEYTFNKNKSVYILNSFSSDSISKKNFKKSSSFEELNQDKYQSGILLFGKYKYKTFNYVYNNDKLYCYNLSFWNNNIYNQNDNIHEFINYIRQSITSI
jgi:hypothetical protein